MSELETRPKRRINLLALNSIWMFSSTAVAQVLTAITFWALARSTSPSELGMLLGGIGIATLFASAIDLGINSLTIRDLAKSGNDSHLFSETLSTKVTITIFACAVWSVGILALSSQFSSMLVLLPLALYIFLADLASTLQVPFRANEQLGRVAVIVVADKMVTLIVVVGLLAAGVGVISYVLGIVSGSLAIALISIAELDRDLLKLHRTNIRECFRLWRSSLNFGIGALASQVQRMDIAIVGALAGSAAAGLYAIPARLTGPLGLLPSAFSSALFPRIARNQDSMGRRRELLLGTILMMVPLIAVLMLAFVFADALITGVFGPKYGDVESLFRVYLIGMIPASMNQPFSVYLQATGNESYVARVVSFGAFFGLTGVVIGTLTAGAKGATVGFLILQTGVLILLAWKLINGSKSEIVQRRPGPFILSEQSHISE